MVKIVITTNKENSDDATLFYFLLACHLSSPPSSPFLGRVLLKLKLFCSNLPHFPYSVLPEAALLAPSDPCVVIGSWGPWEQEIITPRSRWWTTFTTNTLPGRWASTTKGKCASWSTAAAGVWATKLPQVWSGWRACLEWSKLFSMILSRTENSSTKNTISYHLSSLFRVALLGVVLHFVCLILQAFQQW